MENSKVETPLTVGGIYRPKSSGETSTGCKYRILLMDDTEVLYDYFYPHVGWAVTDHLKSTCTFYRMGVKEFSERYGNNGLMHLTDLEHEVIRPDLPVSVELDSASNPDDVAIASRKILIEQYGPRRRQPKVALISSHNPDGLTHGEAISGLSEKNDINSDGKPVSRVKLRRTGIRRMLPLYVIDEIAYR